MNPLVRPDYLAEYLSVRLLTCVAQALPLPAALRLGDWAGRQAAFWTRARFRVALDNVTQAFPAMPRAEAEALVRRVYEHFGRASIESALAPRRMRPRAFADHVSVRNEPLLRQALDEGKGVICLTAHLGVWELYSALLRERGIQPVTVYRPIKNPWLDRMVRRERLAFGQTMVPREGALPTLLRALQEKRFVLLVVDQHVRRGGEWVPFFGRPASATPTPALLALRTGAPILLSYIIRRPGTYRFEAVWDRVLHATRTRDHRADVARVTAEVAQQMERWIRQHPEQWLWLHRRWRTPPPEVLEKEGRHVGPSGQTD